MDREPSEEERGITLSVKLNREQRLQITDKIENTLNQYCRPCEQDEKVELTSCYTCPIVFKLREMGTELEGSEDVKPFTKRNNWSPEEDKLMMNMLADKIMYKDVAAKLDRTLPSIHNRATKLRRLAALKRG